MRTSSRFLASLLVAVAFARPDAVLAAFNGSIDSTSGRPGDRVTVVSADTGPLVVGATGLYLMPAIDPNRPERSINCANEPGSHFLGAFEVLAAMPATDVSPTPTPSRSPMSVAIVLGTLAGCGLLVWFNSRVRGDIGVTLRDDGVTLCGPCLVPLASHREVNMAPFGSSPPPWLSSPWQHRPSSHEGMDGRTVRN